MLRVNRGDVLSKTIVFIVGLMLMAKIFLPILAIGIHNNAKNILLQTLGKSNGALEEYVLKNTQEDEENMELTSYILKNLTGLDISTPKDFLSTQIPLLGLVDTGKDNKDPIIMSNDKSEKKIEENPKKEDEAKKDKAVKNLDEKNPEVLIYHTHTTEGYNPEKTKGQNFTQDLTKTVAKVGDELEKILEEEYGISTVHDKTIHDVPKREGAYAKSRPTVQKHLKENNSYKLVIDLHRDGGIAVEKTTAIINGEKYSRPMFVIGSKNPNIKQSEAIAGKVNNEIEKLYPKLSRGILYKKNTIFNQDLSKNSVLIEVGSDGNSMEESVKTINIVAKAIANTIE